MRTFLMLAIVALAAPLSAPLSARPFTNTEGKTIEAEIVRANSTTVTLLLANERTSTININTLSEEDQEFVRAWLADQVPRLRITPNMVRSTKKSGSRSSYYNSVSYTQSMDLSVEIRNEDEAKRLEETTLKYYLIGRAEGKTSTHKVLLVQEADLEIAAADGHTVHFRKVENQYSDDARSGSSYYGNYKCIGYVLFASRKKDEREVYTYASTPQLEDAIYSIVALKTGDVVDENFQKIQTQRVGVGQNGNNGDPARPGIPPRRVGDPAPTRTPEEAPIRIR